ncbi:MAG TPA: SPASM domain-containing protein [Bryobacteraceae bacterium]|nr:SPASM domain-containing protein [Bryobacteraceae bacterium]
MAENLDQLAAVAEYARSTGAPELSIHPIIGRHLVPHDFSRELTGNQLRDGFKEALRRAVAALRQVHPDFTVNVLNPALDTRPRLRHTPGYYAPFLPEGARIHTCDQPPFESAHILSTGHVVVCEVHDEVSLGNLHEQTLSEIWHGPGYRDFRRRYIDGAIPECRGCVWEQAYIPAPFLSSIAAADGMSPQLLRGWHNYDGNGIVWSKKRALVALANPRHSKRVRLAGMLPHAPADAVNSLAVSCNRRPVGAIQNNSASFASFDTGWKLPEAADPLYIELSTSHLFRPSLYSASSDSRDLGVGLSRIEVSS